jgi:hypothetical protein
MSLTMEMEKEEVFFFFFERHELGLRQVINDVECSLLECYVRYKDGCWSFLSCLCGENVDVDGL